MYIVLKYSVKETNFSAAFQAVRGVYVGSDIKQITTIAILAIITALSEVLKWSSVQPLAIYTKTF